MPKTYKNIFLPIIAILFFLSAITAKGDLMGKWKIIMTLPKLHKAEAFWFGGDVGLVFGHYRSLDDLLNKDIKAGIEKKEAFVLKTVNNGKHWEKTYDGSGELKMVSYREKVGVLYALGREYDVDGKRQSYLIQSKNLGESWSSCELPEDDIVGINFTNQNFGYAWTDNTLYKTKEGSSNWSKTKHLIKVTPNGPSPIVDFNGAIWIVFKDKLVKILHDERKTEIELPNSVIIDRIDIADDNSLWLVGRIQVSGKKRTKIYRCNGMTINEIKDLGFVLPRAFYSGKDNIFLIASDMSEIPPRKFLIYSKDKGKSWKKEEPAISDAIGPVFFEGEETIWSYGSANRIQRRKF